jgi:hypothetical protein
MRRREPLNIDRTWQHSVPVPMPNRPVCVTEHEAIDQLARLPRSPRMFCGPIQNDVVSRDGATLQACGKVFLQRASKQN